MSGLTYKDAGVDIEAGDAFVSKIGPLAKATHRPEVLGGLGGFGGLFALPTGYKDPILVAGTDGVGTKLKIAFDADRHDTVGIDLVAMCANDIICCGAEPLFFLDYFATGKLSPDQGAQVVAGIAQGCSLSGMALLGGETAEMPGFYAPNEYDLAGFAVGIVERDGILTGENMTEGDTLIGLSSSGLHSNGYSLARKVLLDGGDKTHVDALLTPTRIYVKAVQAALALGGVKGCAHITGGGIPGNLVRSLPSGLRAVLKNQSWTVPSIFQVIADMGAVSPDEMSRTFNMGLGMILIVDSALAAETLNVLNEAGEEAQVIGHLESGETDVVYSGNVE